MSTTIDMQTIRPVDEQGSALAGRPAAARIRAQIESAAQQFEVVVDLEGVMMSPSFADELIAKLPRDLLDTGRVRFVNIDEDLAFLVDFVIAGRR